MTAVLTNEVLDPQVETLEVLADAEPVVSEEMKGWLDLYGEALVEGDTVVLANPQRGDLDLLRYLFGSRRHPTEHPDGRTRTYLRVETPVAGEHHLTLMHLPDRQPEYQDDLGRLSTTLRFILEAERKGCPVDHLPGFGRYVPLDQSGLDLIQPAS